MPKPKVIGPRERPVEKFYPKKPLLRIKGKGGEVRITAWNRPRTKEQRQRFARFRRKFEKGQKPRVSRWKIQSLSEAENKELREILGMNTRVSFYRDNRNLFLIRQMEKKMVGFTDFGMYRLRVSGAVEETPYASMTAKVYGNDAEITDVGLLKVGRGSRPRTGHSGRGILLAFVDFLEKRGVKRFEAQGVYVGAEKAYRRAGFKKIEPFFERGFE